MYSEPRSKGIACFTYNCICSESTLNGRLLVTWARKVSLEGPRASLLIGKFPWKDHAHPYSSESFLQQAGELM